MYLAMNRVAVNLAVLILLSVVSIKQNIYFLSLG